MTTTRCWTISVGILVVVVLLSVTKYILCCALSSLLYNSRRVHSCITNIRQTHACKLNTCKLNATQPPQRTTTLPPPGSRFRGDQHKHTHTQNIRSRNENASTPKYITGIHSLPRNENHSVLAHGALCKHQNKHHIRRHQQHAHLTSSSVPSCIGPERDLALVWYRIAIYTSILQSRTRNSPKL